MGRRRAVAVLLGLATVLAPSFRPLSPQPVSPSFPASWAPIVDQFVGELAADVEHDAVGGLTAALARDGALLWFVGFGWADREDRRRAGRETVYRVGSISKSVTATLMAALAREGVVSLNAPLEDHVPEIRRLRNRPPGASPLLRQVASHTAGFVREPALPGAASGPIALWRSRILASIPATSYRTPPGVEYSYSNIGFGILGLALERAAGEPFMDQVEERIFGPAAMSSSGFVADEGLRARLAKGYANGREAGVDAVGPALEHAGRGYKVPNGGVYSTVDDLAAFAAGVMGRGRVDLLGDTLRAQALSVQTPGDPNRGYGLGFSVASVDGRLFAGHGGSVAGYTAHLLFEPATGLTVVLLRNYNRGRTNLGDAARRLLLGLTETESPPEPAPPRE